MPHPYSRLSRIGHWTLSTAARRSLAPFDIQPVETRTIASWGFTRGILHRESLGLDTLTFSRPVQRFDATPEINYGDLVILKDPANVTRFVGRRILVPGIARGNGEAQEWFFAGPWFWLQRLVYKQEWGQLLINGAIVPRTTSHLLLNRGLLATCAAQITHVLQFAIDAGAPLQVGLIQNLVTPFITEVTDQTCAQVIADQLRFSPNSVVWFDYTANPPAIHCTIGGGAGPVYLHLGGGPAAGPEIADDGLRIMARPDLRVDAVVLRYERTDTLDGQEYLALGEDIYPPGADGNGLNDINATITLAGFSRTTVRGSILCEDIDTGSLAFWKRHIPALQSDRIKNLAIVSHDPTVDRVLQGSRTDANPAGIPSQRYERWLVEGQLVDWMRDATDNALDWEQEEISAEFSFDLDVDASSGVKLEKVPRMRFRVNLVATTAPAGESEYSTTETEEEGEVQPVSLAQLLYNQLNGLDHEGTVQTTQPECTGYIGPGNGLNINGTADPLHGDMNARVQAVDEILDTGHTNITFGPIPALSLSAILEFMRATRHRRRWTRSSVQDDGQNASNGNVQLGQATSNNNTIPAERQRTLFACQDGVKRVVMDATDRQIAIRSSTPATASLVAESTDAHAHLTVFGANGAQIRLNTAEANGKILYAREENWCDPETGARKKIMVIASDPYD